MSMRARAHVCVCVCVCACVCIRVLFLTNKCFHFHSKWSIASPPPTSQMKVLLLKVPPHLCLLPGPQRCSPPTLPKGASAAGTQPAQSPTATPPFPGAGNGKSEVQGVGWCGWLVERGKEQGVGWWAARASAVVPLRSAL